jgi:putative transposase
MPSHEHIIMGTHGKKMEHILRDTKRHTSKTLHMAIWRHPGERRKEWLQELMWRADTANSNNRGFQLWQQDNHPIELHYRVQDKLRLYKYIQVRD